MSDGKAEKLQLKPHWILANQHSFYTLQKYLIDLSREENNKENSKPSLLILDEASMVSSKQMNQLLQHVNHTHVRLVMVGDIRFNPQTMGFTFSLCSTQAKNFVSEGTGNRSKLAFMVKDEQKVRELYKKWKELGVIWFQPRLPSAAIRAKRLYVYNY